MSAGKQLEEVHAEVAKPLGQLALMIAQKRLSRKVLQDLREKLQFAITRIDLILAPERENH